MCRSELSAVIARLMSKCLWAGGSGELKKIAFSFPCYPVNHESTCNKTQIEKEKDNHYNYFLLHPPPSPAVLWFGNVRERKTSQKKTHTHTHKRGALSFSANKFFQIRCTKLAMVRGWWPLFIIHLKCNGGSICFLDMQVRHKFSKLCLVCKAFMILL